MSALCCILLALLPHTMSNTILLDTGASYHMINDASKLENIYKLESPMSINTGAGVINLEWAGTAYIQAYNGSELPIKLQDTLFNPSLKVNLMSFGLAMNACEFKFPGTSIQAYVKISTTLLFDARRNESNVFPVGIVLDPFTKTPDSVSSSNSEYASLMAMLHDTQPKRSQPL